MIDFDGKMVKIRLENRQISEKFDPEKIRNFVRKIHKNRGFLGENSREMSDFRTGTVKIRLKKRQISAKFTLKNSESS